MYGFIDYGTWYIPGVLKILPGPKWLKKSKSVKVWFHGWDGHLWSLNLTRVTNPTRIQ